MKSLNSFAPGKGKRESQESERVNNYDRPSHDNPNAMGPTMCPVSDATTRHASHWADQHDAGGKPAPYVQSGAVATGIGSRAERKDGAGGSW